MNMLQYKEYFKKIIFNSRFSRDTRVKEGCLAIIDIIFSRKSITGETSFYFDELRQGVHENINDEDFITSIFYLTRKNINILEQNFSALNSERNEYEPIPQFKKDVIQMMKKQDYYNPLSGDNLTVEEFSKQVLTYFNVTSSLLEIINQDYE